MPVKMVAIRRHYDKANGVEYKAGQTFEVPNEAAADRLENLLKKAKRHTEPAAPRAAVRNKVMTPEPTPEPTPPAPEPVAQPVSFGSFPTENAEGTRRGRYRRNDLRSED